MAKYIYEKWSLKWDFSNQSIQANSRSIYSIAGDVYQLNGTVVTRHYRAGDVLKYSGNFGVVTTVTGERTYFREYKLSDTKVLYSLRVKNKLIDTIIGDDSIYPIDGIAKDTDRNDYWFVRKESLFPELKVNIGGSLKTVTSAMVVINGQLRNVTEVYTVINGALKKIK